MIDPSAFESLVTPAEYHRTVCAEGNTALLMGVVWNAGRVQGIREERARRKHVGKLFYIGR